MSLHVYPDAAALSQAVADALLQALRATPESDPFNWVLSGGSTPKQLYELLAREPYRSQLPWRRLRIFWGDERWVPHDDPDSNVRMAREALLNHVAISDEQIFPIPYAASPEASAEAYEATLKQAFPRDMPAFDLLLLGLGDNGHTASLFPRTPALHETQHWVAAVQPLDNPIPRITLTVPVLNHAKRVAFMVTGAGKAQILSQVLDRYGDADMVPALLIQPSTGALDWYVDKAAAALRQSDSARA